MNRNGKLTATEDVIFYVSYGILADRPGRNSYAFLKRNTEKRLRMNGNITLETRHYTLLNVKKLDSESLRAQFFAATDTKTYNIQKNSHYN